MDESVSVDVLRREAADELAAVIEYRCRRGDDPWEFLPEMPSVDEQVVLTLRRDYLDELDHAETRARAHHPAAGDHGSEFEYELLRRIGLDHPELTGAVWALLGRV